MLRSAQHDMTRRLCVTYLRYTTLGRTAAVQALLEAGADVNTRNTIRNTPLMLVANWGHTEIVQVLLANGADVHAKNTIGMTACIFPPEGDTRKS